MSLSRKLFLLVGGLLCLLLLGQWWLFRTLSRDVSRDVRKVAFKVGEEIVSGFAFRTEGVVDAGADEKQPIAPGKRQAHVVVLATERAGEENADATERAANGVEAIEVPPEFEAGEPVRPGFRFRQELHWRTAEGEPLSEVIERKSFGPGGEHERFFIATDGNPDQLFVRGPSLERTIPIPAAQVASTLDRFGSRMFAGSVILLAVGLGAAALLAHRMSRPLAELARAAERVGAGELGLAVPARAASTKDEVGRAVVSFNAMSARLAELDRENRRLAEAEQLSELGDVARGLAHSLRNPLNALGLTIERLGARPAGEASAEELVEGSRRQIRRIDGALRSFLALASAGAAQAEPVDLAALAREVALEALQDLGRGTRIEVDSASGVTNDKEPSGGENRLEVLGVDAELKAILQALVINACEAAAATAPMGSMASPPPPMPLAGEAGPRVVVRLRSGEAGRVRIEVEDNGSGLPDRVREHLFEPHVTTKAHGSGMGLFLAHRLATARYGGALRLESLARGTRAVLEVGDRLGLPA